MDEPQMWARVQWGGSNDPSEEGPTHISTFQGLLHSAIKPRWVRSVLCGAGGMVAGEDDWSLPYAGHGGFFVKGSTQGPVQDGS